MYKFTLLVFLLILLESCAQMGTINGGPKDDKSPKIVKGGIQPPNESLHFSANKIRFNFDEFIQLNNPIQTLSIVPNDIQISAKAVGKQMELTLEGTPKPNTTYVINMNGTVKDITESNDSLMQYVFSTGSFIDSLTYFGYVLDAKEHTPVKNCFVGLYDNSDSAIFKKPLYYATTNSNGEFKFKYLKPGNFNIYAYNDDNRDSKWQVTEKVAFVNSEIQIAQEQKDTLHLLLFQQKLPQKLNIQYTFPSKFTLAGRNPLDIKSIFVDGQAVQGEDVLWYKDDSLSFIKNVKSDAKSYDLVIEHHKNDTKTDSITVRGSNPRMLKHLKPSFEIIQEKPEYLIGDSIVFAFSDNIQQINPKRMELLIHDSIPVSFKNSFNKRFLTIHLDSTKGKLVNFNMLKGGITFENFSDSITFTHLIKMVDISTLGSLTLDFSKLPDNAIVEMYRGKNLLQTFNLNNSGKKAFIDKLQAGNYGFKAYIDGNGDGKWTAGDFYQKVQPEKVLRFKDNIQVRASWDIEAELVPLDEK